jgi:dGTPase
VERTHPRGIEKLKFNEAAKRLLDHLATGLIEHTQAALASSGVQTVEDVRRAPTRLAGFSPPLSAENATLKKFLLTRLYENPTIVSDREQSVAALSELFHLYEAHPEAMPKAYTELAQRTSKYRVICDYIAGMTDHFLLRLHAELLGTARVRTA